MALVVQVVMTWSTLELLKMMVSLCLLKENLQASSDQHGRIHLIADLRILNS